MNDGDIKTGACIMQYNSIAESNHISRNLDVNFNLR